MHSGMMGNMNQFDRFPTQGFNHMQHPAFMGTVPPGSQPMNPNFSNTVIERIELQKKKQF